jgi:hypothetical protein
LFERTGLTSELKSIADQSREGKLKRTAREILEKRLMGKEDTIKNLFGKELKR